MGLEGITLNFFSRVNKGQTFHIIFNNSFSWSSSSQKFLLLENSFVNKALRCFKHFILQKGLNFYQAWIFHAIYFDDTVLVIVNDSWITIWELKQFAPLKKCQIEFKMWNIWKKFPQRTIKWCRCDRKF